MAGVRRFARWARFVLGVLFMMGIAVQFLLAGYGLFENRDGFDVHETLGYTVMHWIPILILLAGLLIWRPLADLVLSVAIGVLGAVQPVLADAGDWAGVFHPVNALVLFLLAHRLSDRDWHALRRRELPAAGETGAEPARVS